MPKIIENPRSIILDTAKNILHSEGYDGLTMRNISKECGIGLGTVYNYFPDKKAIVYNLMEEFWDDYLIIVDKIDMQEKDIYVKFQLMYNELENFVNLFMEMLARINSERARGPKRDNKERKKSFTEKLIKKVEIMLINHFPSSKIEESEVNDFARFIVSNMVMMSHMKEFNYDSFEKILRKLLG
ncbi:TetR/AcrR family transcriptional regulator [Clostridium swellfunianum]|uniref:TetR/AcrR family transcriptional regulator n=1 Tax=Clostridium swellfunianum TaxID=1367462 RepID=UPI00202F512C|nr:TetR/AcrR family transcriptional regulator [Clostridium swellfunianum]MCM0647072.1 TetR/AcrR family transcriptional regulator [Clostridium swellfunianum]